MMRCYGPRRRVSATRPALLAALALFASACATLSPGGNELVVTATAYNSLPGQTDSTPNTGAWGDRLTPGMRAIAVSRDLLEMGLVRGSLLRVEGLPDEYQVLDKMAQRWRRRIDIFMGTDRRAAQSWGIRSVRIHWLPPTQRSGLWCRLTGRCD